MPVRSAPALRLAGALAALALLPLPAHAQAFADRAAFLPPPSSWAAPAFALPTRTGDTLRLSDARGRVVLVNFWATWCGPCLREIPDLARLARDLGPYGLTVIGVSIDEGGWTAVQPFAERLAIPYPLVLDDGRTGAAFGSSEMMPTTFVVDRRGFVRLVEKGALDLPDVQPIVEALLAEGAPCIGCRRLAPAPFLEP